MDLTGLGSLVARLVTFPVVLRIDADALRSNPSCETAAELDCDLIVMSSHRVQSERPAADWISISHKVAILAACPILLVK